MAGCLTSRLAGSVAGCYLARRAMSVAGSPWLTGWLSNAGSVTGWQCRWLALQLAGYVGWLPATWLAMWLADGWPSWLLAVRWLGGLADYAAG